MRQVFFKIIGDKRIILILWGFFFSMLFLSNTVSATTINGEMPAYRFDFGIRESPVQLGFVQVTPNTEYDSNRGYGWSWRAASPKGHSWWPAVVFPDPLGIDWIEANGIFNLNLPNGQYKVFLIIKKVLQPDTQRFVCWVSAEGVAKVSIDERETSPEKFWYLNDYEQENNIWQKYIAPLFIERTFTVGVKDGQLNLMFYPASVAALIVYPESKAAEVEAEIQNMQLEREKKFSRLPQVPKGFLVWGKKGEEAIIPPGWREVKSRQRGKALPLTKKDKDRGYVIFRKNYLDLVYPNTVPEEDEITDKIETFVALGEYEPVTFTIRALQDLNKVKVAADDLVSEDGDIIKKENIDVRMVRYLPKKVGRKRYKLEPLILEKRKEVEIKKDTSQRFWITIYVPEEAKPGSYTTKIRVVSENKGPEELTLKVKVLPIKLKTPDTVYGIYYNGDTRWKGFYPRNIKKHFIDMREHGLNSTTLYATPEISMVDSKLKFDFSKGGEYSPWGIEKVIKIYTEAGLDGPIIYTGLTNIIDYQIRWKFKYKMYSRKFDKIYQQMVSEIKKKQEEENWPEFLFNPVDEAANSKEGMKKGKYYLKLLKAAVPRAKTIMTLNGGWRGLDDGKIFDPWLDVRCYNWVTKKVIEDTKKAGDMFWIYNGGGRKPTQSRYFYGFYAARTTATGITQWVYQWPPDLNTNPYRELEGIDRGGRHGWYYTYPSPQGPLPTPAWEGIREGIDDARYLYTLRTLIKKARDSKDIIIRDEAKKAEEDVERILQSIELKLQTKERKKVVKFISENSSILNEWRWEIAQRIMELQDLLAPKNSDNS